VLLIQTRVNHEALVERRLTSPPFQFIVYFPKVLVKVPQSLRRAGAVVERPFLRGYGFVDSSVQLVHSAVRSVSTRGRWNSGSTSVLGITRIVAQGDEVARAAADLRSRESGGYLQCSALDLPRPLFRPGDSVIVVTLPTASEPVPAVFQRSFGGRAWVTLKLFGQQRDAVVPLHALARSCADNT
jgi:hypothetical protein